MGMMLTYLIHSNSARIRVCCRQDEPFPRNDHFPIMHTAKLTCYITLILSMKYHS